MRCHSKIPSFVPVVVLLLGFYDLIRGFMHTFMVSYSAANVAGLDLTIPQAADLLKLMGAFGISNFVSGCMLILIAWQSRFLSLVMLGLLPVIYFIGCWGMQLNLQHFPATHAVWGGAKYLVIYLTLCCVTFVCGLGVTLYNKKLNSKEV